jgi:hypothetical protein
VIPGMQAEAAAIFAKAVDRRPTSFEGQQEAP